jgi:hypothetical protein
MDNIDTTMPDDFIEHFTREVMDFQLFESGVTDAIKREVSEAVRQTLRTRLAYEPGAFNWDWIGAELGLDPDAAGSLVRAKLEERVIGEVIKNTDFHRLMKDQPPPQLSETRSETKKNWVCLLG